MIPESVSKPIRYEESNIEAYGKILHDFRTPEDIMLAIT